MSFKLLGKEQVLERWDILIAQADGKGEGVFSDTEQSLADSKAPDTKIKRRSVGPGIMQGILGGQRTFLVIDNTTNDNLKPYRMYINARDYGANLQVCWYLVAQPSIWQTIIGLILRIPVIGLLGTVHK